MVGRTEAVGKVLALLTAATLLVAGVAGCSNSRAARGSLNDGPVQFESDPNLVQASGIDAKVGQTVVFGQTTVRNSGNTAAELASGSLVGNVAADDAELVGVRVIDLKAHPGDLVGAAPWPFEDYAARSVKLAGFSLPPGAEAELLFLVRVRAEGYWQWPSSSLRYASNGKSYEIETNTGVQVCTPRADTCD